MSQSPRIDWEAIEADPRFQHLHRRKSRFLWGLLLFSLLYYFLLPLGAAYTPALFRKTLWGPLNFGLLFALSEFVVAWAVAVIYARRSDLEFDVLAAEIVAAQGGTSHE